MAARRRLLPVVKASACPAQGPSPSLACDKEILLSIRDRLDPPGVRATTSWHPDAPLTDFTGVAVGGSPPRVRALSLNDLYLGGSIPPALGRLAHLQSLELSNTHLVGPLPPALGQLAQLQRLDLSHNRGQVVGLGRRLPRNGASSPNSSTWICQATKLRIRSRPNWPNLPNSSTWICRTTKLWAQSRPNWDNSSSCKSCISLPTD